MVNKKGEPDYEPPFGSRPQPKEEFQKIHDRWIKRMGSMKQPADRQCGGCCYYIPLEGSIGQDWGACSNPKSSWDGTVVFEHFTCRHHREIEQDSKKGMRMRDIVRMLNRESASFSTLYHF